MYDTMNGMEITCRSSCGGIQYIRTIENATPVEMACFIGSQSDMSLVTISRKEEDTPFLAAERWHVKKCDDADLGRQVDLHLKVVRRNRFLSPQKRYSYEELETMLAVKTPA